MCAGADGHLTRSTNDRYCVNRVRAVHRVLMNTRRAKTLVVSSNDDPTRIDPILGAWDSVVDLLRRPGVEVGAKFTGRVWL